MRAHRKSSFLDYRLFQPVVELSPAIVESHARKRVRQEIEFTEAPRVLINHDRQKAAYELIKLAILTLRPPAAELDQSINDAFNSLPYVEWNKYPVVPPECYHFLSLYYAYLHKPAITAEQLVRLFGMSERVGHNLRNAALHWVVSKLYQWEREECIRRDLATPNAPKLAG
jgi:hypothetical protein